MLFDRICGNSLSDDLAPPSDDDERAELSWSDCLRRTHTIRTSGGETLRVLLPLGVWLRHGDVITDGRRRLFIHLRACDVLVIRPENARQAALIGLTLGNLHAPVQCEGEDLITPADGPVEELLTGLGARFERQHRRFEPELLAAPLRAQLAADFQVWRTSDSGAAGKRMDRSQIASTIEPRSL